jgi:hypothetical protein
MDRQFFLGIKNTFYGEAPITGSIPAKAICHSVFSALYRGFPYLENIGI